MRNFRFILCLTPLVLPLLVAVEVCVLKGSSDGASALLRFLAVALAVAGLLRSWARMILLGAIGLREPRLWVSKRGGMVWALSHSAVACGLLAALILVDPAALVLPAVGLVVSVALLVVPVPSSCVWHSKTLVYGLRLVPYETVESVTRVGWQGYDVRLRGSSLLIEIHSSEAETKRFFDTVKPVLVGFGVLLR